MKQYDVSIVIPVYNCEQYIEDNIEAIYNQDYPQKDKIQVILVDDGSTDNSLKVCNELKEKYNELDIEIITGENGGVSVARNKGIKASKGKYIMFIDSDDFISKNAINKLVQFFDDHYDEIDLATYSMDYYLEAEDKQIDAKKYVNFDKGTDVYDLNGEYYYLIQTNMNVIVKNYFKDNILFDINLHGHEDTKYDTEILMKKRKIGYVEDAKYIYRKHQGQTTGIINNPYYTFDDMMSLFEYCINNFVQDDGHVYKYVQSIIVNIFRWRIAQDNLLPYFYRKNDYTNAINRLNAILKKIDNEIITNDKLMDKFHKAFLISLKNSENINIKRSYDGLVYSINDKNNILFNEDKIEIVLNRMKLIKDKLYILGYLRSTLLMYKEPELVLIHKNKNKETKKINIQLSQDTLTNRYRTDMEIARFYKFEFEIDFYETSSIKLQVKIDGKPIDIRYIFNNGVPISGKFKNYKSYFNDYRIRFNRKKNIFYISKPRKKTRIKDLYKSFKRFYKLDKNVCFYRVMSYLYKKTVKRRKKIWLYYDRKNIFDNAYSQFNHDIKIKDNIKKYYILDGNKKDFKDKFSVNERIKVIRFGSFKHKILFLNSDKILTSFSSLSEFCPFPKKFMYYKDILKYDLIYLQHGVLHARLLKMYGKEFAPIDKFVISSNFEKENLINNYGYSKKDLICTGMPRFEEEIPNEKPENKIIFAPSWRQYLIGKAINRKRAIDEDGFKKSKYFTETMKFLTDKKLLEILEKNNITLDYKLHPIFEPYEKCFGEAKSKNVTVSIGGTDLSKCKAFITDFSSFQFDFVRLVRPIIYFMPDMTEFKAGLHTYRELDLKYENAFGNLCLTGEELSKEILKIIDNNFEPEPIYKERMEKFFFKVKHRKDRLYDILKEN